MPSRRKRKRCRRLAPDARLRGDRQTNSSPSTSAVLATGVGGQLRGDWKNASLSDLILLRKAIKENWPVPLENRRPLIEAVASILRLEDGSYRRAASACQVILAAEEHNQKLHELDRARKTL